MDVVSYKCPNCGAPLVFSIETQKWECHFCLSSFTKDELDLFDKNEGRTEPEPASWDAVEFQDLVNYSCPNCGGKVMADQNTVAQFCPYCHNPNVIASRLTGEYQPARILPFKIPKEEVMVSLLKMIRKKPLLPRYFREIVKEGEITGLYVPYWLFSANIDASMAAEGMRISSWSDSNYHYTKTDIYNVQRKIIMPLRKIPLDASSRLDDKLMDSIEPFDCHLLEPFSMEYLSGYFAESFDVDAQTSKARFMGRAGQAAGQTLRASVTGYSNLSVSNETVHSRGLDNLYTMLPVWLASVEFKGETYTFAVNAQTGKSAGRLPVSTGRSLAVFAVATLAFFLVALGINLYLGGYI